MIKQTAKVFEINDTEWWAGYDLQSVLEDYAKQCGFDADEMKEYAAEAAEVSAEVMEKLRFHYNLDNSIPNLSTSVTRSFAEELALLVTAGVSFPRFFATTEF